MQLYYPEITLAVGEPFAIKNPYGPDVEAPVLATYADGLHLTIYSNNAELDLETFSTDTMIIGLTSFYNIPFIALTFQNSPLSLLYSLNVYCIIGDERRGWLNSTSSEINVLLVDNQTGQLICKRELETKLVQKLKHYCREQLEQYGSAEQVATEVAVLLDPPHDNPVTAQRVMERANLSNLFVVQYVTNRTEVTSEPQPINPAANEN